MAVPNEALTAWRRAGEEQDYRNREFRTACAELQVVMRNLPLYFGALEEEQVAARAYYEVERLLAMAAGRTTRDEAAWAELNEALAKWEKADKLYVAAQKAYTEKVRAASLALSAPAGRV